MIIERTYLDAELLRYSFKEKHGYDSSTTNDEVEFFTYNQDKHLGTNIAIALRLEVNILAEQAKMGLITEHDHLKMLNEWINQLSIELVKTAM